MKRLALALLFFVPWASFAQESGKPDDNTVQWYIYSAPPISIVHGPNRGEGWADKRLQILTKRLTAFRHENADAGIARLMEDIKTKPNVCNTGLLKTPERETFIEFSEPFAPILPNGVLTSRERFIKLKPFLNEHGDLRLGDLLKDGRQRIGLISGAKYGKGIDAVLADNMGRPNVVMVPSNNESVGLFLKLTQQDEYDIAPAYAVELRYLARESKLQEKDFVFLNVAEQPSLVPTYVGCSKTPFGKRVIAEVNKLIADEQVKKEDVNAYRSWLDDRTAARYDSLRKQAK